MQSEQGEKKDGAWTPPPFKIGDIVMLKSGSMAMTVVDIERMCRPTAMSPEWHVTVVFCPLIGPKPLRRPIFPAAALRVVDADYKPRPASDRLETPF